MRDLLFLSLIILGITGCKNDCGEHFRYEVDFYTNHEDFKIVAPMWETVTEQVLVKDAYMSQGFSFEIVTEQVLKRDAYTYRKIAEATLINLVVDAELNSIQQIACYRFYPANDFIKTEVPAEYETRSYQKAIHQGTGTEIPAVYGTRTYERLIKDSELIPNTDSRTFNRVVFNIPIDQNIQAYLENQLAQEAIEDCIEGNSFDYQ